MKNHWYKRDPEAALNGMASLTLEERGAYNGVLDLLYSKGGDLPDDDDLISRVLRINPRTWRKQKDALIRKGKIWQTQGKLTAKRVEYCLNEAANFSETQRNKANKRWKNNDAPMPDGNALQPQPQPQPDISSLRSDIGASQAKPPKATKSRRSVPDDFPTKADQDWARDFWLQRGRTDLCTQIADEIAKFRDHHTGHGKSMADWPAAWRTWTRNAIKFNNGAHNGRPKPQSAHDKFLSAGESIIREIMGEAGEGGAGDDLVTPRHQLLSP